MKFLADVMVCNLARWLRILGFDTTSANNKMSDNELLLIATKEQRILLTRDKKLGNRKNVYFLKSTTISEQLTELKKAFGLKIEFPKNTRCAVCNGELEQTTREKLEKKVPEKTKSNAFWVCKACGKAYWKGSHWKRIIGTLQKLR